MTAIRKIFISYRQSDNRAFVVRIRDWLVNNYGRDNVFMDFDTLPPFVKFEDFIKQRIAESDVILAIIGDGWLHAFADKAAEGEKDYVLIELETALKSGKLIAPVLIMGAQMPRRRDVPEVLQELCEYNAARLSDDRAFYDEIERVIGALEGILGGNSSVAPTVTKLISTPQHPLQVQAALIPGWLSDLISIPSKIFNVNSDFPSWDHYFDAAYKQEEQGDLEGAYANYSAAIQLNPESAATYHNRGNVRFNRGDLSGAIDDYSEAIRLNPRDPRTYHNRGNIYFELNQMEEAIKNYSYAIQLGRRNSKAYNNRGAARFALGDLDGAITDYSEAIRLNRRNAYGYLGRGVTYQKKGEFGAAIDDWQRAMELDVDYDHAEIEKWILSANDDLRQR